MKKIILTTFLLLNIICFSQQTKKEIISEIESYKKSKLQNSSYDFTYKEIYDAMTIMGNQYFGNAVKESESRWYAEYLKEDSKIKVELTIDIKGEKQPYRLSFNYKKQQKSQLMKTDGVFGTSNFKATVVDGDWKTVDVPIDLINTNLHLRIYKILNGEFKLPEELLKKIDDFNRMEKKDKKKILAGVDYEI